MKKDLSKHHVPGFGSSGLDNEVSVTSVVSKEDGFECPICFESFNVVENVPYILWCGHTMCMNCILCLQRALVKFPTLPVQLPLFISCPWCNLLCLRVVYKGELKFPRKNYFLLWMVENRNGDRFNSHSTTRAEVHHHQQNSLKSSSSVPANRGADANYRSRPRHNARRVTSSTRTDSDGTTRSLHNLTMERLHTSFQKSLVFFVHFIAKLPLVIVFLLVVIYAVPACAAILIIYVLVTLVFAVPSFLVLYLSYPALDWLVGEIMS